MIVKGATLKGAKLGRWDFVLPCSAGRFNFSWSNPTGRLWIFPGGTVLHSDGVTPISTSTDEQPDVDIPAGGGTVILRSANWGGNYELNDNDTNVKYVGDFSDLPNLSYYLNLSNCTNITGDLSDLPSLSYYLVLYNCTNITGDLSDLPSLSYYLSLTNCTNVTGAYTNVSGNNVPTYTYLNNTGMSATDMDNTLIAYAATTKSNGTFSANGMTRTAASDDAVSTLTGRGWTITGITKI